MASMAKFEAYKKAAQQTAEATRWVAHNNAEGRRWSGNQDILRLSPAHSSIKLVIAGQYSEGGQNYWDSPKPFNVAIMSVIVDQFDALAQAALAKLKDAEAEALIAAKGEVDEAAAEITAATGHPPRNASEAEAEAAIARARLSQPPEHG